MQRIEPKKKVCLVTPGHLSSTPRLLKEADALAELGYDVVVVSARHFPPVDALDRSVENRSSWTSVRVDACPSVSTVIHKVARRLAQVLLKLAPRPPLILAALAEDAVSPRIAAAAAAQRADLYIGHCIGGLYSAAEAARRAGSVFGFDIEDYHDGETAAAMESPALSKATRLLQRALLPRARYLTAASPLISKKNADVYGVRSQVILNVFPRSEAPAGPLQPPRPTQDAPAVLYWFSQTTGAGRGIEQMLSILSKMGTPAQLHLRGFCSDTYRKSLEDLSRELGLRHPPLFLPPAEPAEMARLAASAHAGLCVELTAVPNHDLCLANKIFTYMLAGTPALLSRTQAHIELAPDLGPSARLIDLNDPGASAKVIDALLQDPDALALARKTAWEKAHSRYCWDVEKTAFTALVEAAVGNQP